MATSGDHAIAHNLEMEAHSCMEVAIRNLAKAAALAEEAHKQLGEEGECGDARVLWYHVRTMLNEYSSTDYNALVNDARDKARSSTNYARALLP